MSTNIILGSAGLSLAMSVKEHFDSSSDAEDGDQSDWPTYKSKLQKAVTASGTRNRIHALKQVSARQGSFSLSQCKDLQKI